MYWLYFFLLIIAISTPIFIESESLRLSEDMREAAIILVAGTLGFLLYILREKSLLKLMSEKLWFQQKTTTITKDLSQSYSYIGEVNRKVDILKGMMERMVELDSHKKKEGQKIFWEVIDTVKHLCQADAVSIRMYEEKECTHRVEERADKKIFSTISDDEILEVEKKIFEIKGVHCISKDIGNSKIVLLLSQKHNDEIDGDILSIILDFLVFLQKRLPKGKSLL